MQIDDDTFYDFVQNGNFTVLINGESPSYYGSYTLPYTIKLTANEGYAFTNASSNDYDPVEGDYLKFTINPENVATKTFNSSTGEFNYLDWTFTTVATTPQFDLNINTEFLTDLGDINGVLYVNDVVAVEGNGFNFPYTVKLVANSGYEYATSKGSYDPVNDDFESFDMTDPKAITKTFTSSTGTFDPYYWTFTTQAETAPPDPEPEPSTFDYRVTQAFIDDLASKKATMFINDIQAKAGDEYNLPYDVRIEIANTHYATRYNSKYYDPIEGDYLKFNTSPDFKILTRTLTIAEKTDHDEPNFNQFYSVEGYYVETDIDESVVVPDKVAYNDVFVLTPEQAREIATTQFTYYQSNKGDAPATPIPQGENVISFIDLPFIIDPSLIQGKKQIKIGVINSFITADYLNIDNYLLDLGNITVPDDKQNYLSFENTTAILHLPYANPINIDIDYVIGQTINITYNVNFYDGIASVNITSSKINGVIDTKSIKLNINIPFGKPDDNPSDNSPRNIDFGIDNGVLRPYIEILRNDAILENGFFTIPVPDETLLVEQNGFIKIDEIDLKVKASKDEKEMILNAINQGVIIK